MSAPYFTWPDRRFKYECRGCGACCKGHGIGVDVVAGQLVQLVGKRPELAAFVRRRGDAITAFNPRDRCWFLADDGLCRVEVEDGRAAKPASCRLFPFNRVFAVGETMVVDYNSVICPLAVVADGQGVSHAEVLAEIDTIKDPAIVGTTLPSPGTGVMEREQTSATALFAATDVESAWTAQDHVPVADGIEMASRAFDELLELPWRAPGPDTLANAIALTPSMRFNELFGPRRVIQPQLSDMWLAWLGFASLGERLAERSLGLQELTTLWSEQAPLMRAFSFWDATPVFKPGPVELPNVDPGNLVRSFGQRLVDNKKRKDSLGSLVRECFGKTDVAARVAALRMAEPILRAASWTGA